MERTTKPINQQNMYVPCTDAPDKTKIKSQHLEHEPVRMHLHEYDEATTVPLMKPSHHEQADLGAWVVSDRSGLRQRVLQLNNFNPVTALHHDLHSRGKLCSMMDRLNADKPCLLWVRLAGPAMGSGNRRDDQRSTFLARLILEQLGSGRHVLLEGNVRSQGWNLRAIKELEHCDMRESLHAWCRHQSSAQDACSATTRILSDLAIHSTSECLCPADRTHFTQKQFHNPEEIESAMLNYIAKEVNELLCNIRDRQPELYIPKMEASISNASISTASERKTSSTTKADNFKTNATAFKTISTAKVSFPKSSISTTSSALRTTKADESTSQVENDSACFQNHGISQSSCAFPTEQANRQKERKKAGIAVKKRKQYVEQHKDDVGEDLSSLQVSDSEVAYCQALQANEDILSVNEHVYYSLLLTMPLISSDHQHREFLTMNEMKQAAQTFLSTSHQKVHVCELFGGAGLTSHICSRMFDLTVGRNFDTMHGIDLNNELHRDELKEYLKLTKPDVIVMAPPCKGFGPWSYLNEVIHPESVHEARREGIPLAILCAEIATDQLRHNRLFIIEQPRTSILFQLPAWKKLAPQLAVAYCDQCRFGLKNRNHEHLKKPTVFAASSETLLAHVRNVFCLGNHQHAKVTSEAERWPHRLCKSIALGVADTIEFDKIKFDQHLFYGPTFTCPGCRGHLRKDDPKHVRDETCRYPTETSFEWTCEACKRNRHRSHPSHTLDHTCRWAVARSHSEGGPRPSRGHYPRDPRIPASADPTAALRPVAEEDVAAREVVRVDAEAVEPERLTPEQAARRRADKRSSEVQVGFDPGLVDAAALVPVPVRSDAASPLASSDQVQPNPEDAQAIIPIVDQPTWSRFDLGASLQLLRSVRPGVVRRTLRKLHIRWYHAPARRMGTLLTAAGVAPAVIALLPDIVSTCNICRAWSRPGARSVTSTRLPERFNLEVELDLLFVGSHIVLHMIDRCIRWSVGIKIPDKTTNSLLNGIRDGWINQYGAPNEFISDQEGGLNDMAAAVLEQLGVKLTLRARGQHAAIVERHNEILRRQLHLVDMQSTADGLAVSFHQILNESIFAKNCLLQYGGYSPYEALYGRTPGLLDVMATEDDVDKEHPVRLRTLAVQSMMQAAAEDRIRRANSTKTRVSGELKDLQTGDLVDIYRPTLSKDVPRWNGPATVVDLTSLRDGIIGVRWQGRNIQMRVQDVRRALAFAYAPIFFGGGSSPIEVLRRAAESFDGVMRVGWIRHQDTWESCEGHKDFQQVLISGLHVSAINLQLVGVFGFHFGCNTKTVSGLLCDETLMCWWKPGEFESWNYAFMDGNKPINLHNLGSGPVAFVQFLMEDSVAIAQIRKMNQDIANIGGVHEPRMPLVQEISVADSRLRARLNRSRTKMLEDRCGEESEDEKNPDTTITDNEPESLANPEVEMITPEETILPNEGVDTQPDETTALAWMCSAAPPLQPCFHSFPDETFVIASDDEPAELEISPSMCQYLVLPEQEIAKYESYQCWVFQYGSDNAETAGPVIERTHNVLTREEALKHVDQCRESMIKELNRWHKHGAWRRLPLSQSRNLLRSKWVLKWKDISGKKDVKGRLVAQGFQDRQNLSTFSGTTTRWGQRIVMAVSTQFGWRLASADVSEAFLRGITFEELHRLDPSQPLRQVEIALPPGSEELLRTLPGMSDFSSASECLSLLKPGFGLKDAPRLWNLALQQVLGKANLKCVQVDRQLFCKHDHTGQLVC